MAGNSDRVEFLVSFICAVCGSKSMLRTCRDSPRMPRHLDLIEREIVDGTDLLLFAATGGERLACDNTCVHEQKNRHDHCGGNGVAEE